MMSRDALVSSALVAWVGVVLWTGCGAAPAASESTVHADDTPTAPAPAGRASACDDCAERGRALYRAGDPAGARPLLERACGEADAGGCALLGALYVRGEGGPPDPARGLEHFARGCEGGHAGACAELGAIVLEGAGVPVDRERALVASDAGCRGGVEPACTNLAIALVRGPAEGHGRARQVAEESCGRGHLRACLVLGLLLRDGVGGPADLPRAAALFEEPCAEGDPDACLSLGLAYRRGLGVEADPGRAQASYRRACELGHRRACEASAEIERERSRESAARAAPPAVDPPVVRPAYRTTMGRVTLEGTTFTDVRATCGMMQVMAVLAALRPALARCAAPVGVSMTLAGGRVTEVSASPAGAAGRCATRTARAARFGGVDCTLELQLDAS